jgi:hypothetical protein
VQKASVILVWRSLVTGTDKSGLNSALLAHQSPQWALCYQKRQDFSRPRLPRLSSTELVPRAGLVRLACLA